MKVWNTEDQILEAEMAIYDEEELKEQCKRITLMDKALEKAKMKVFMDAYIMDMETSPEKYFKQEEFHGNIGLYNAVKTLMISKGRKWGYMRVCFTLKSENDNEKMIPIMMKRLKKIFKWKWVKSVTYNVEWGNAKDMKHMHSHALIELKEGKRYSQAKKQLINAWSYGYVQILPTNDSKVDYIIGKKCDSKMAKVKNDKIIRKKHGLLDFYVVHQ